MQRYNLAARAARWSAAHWKTAVAVWVAFVLVAIALGTAVGTHKLSDSEQSTGESARAEQILASAGFKTPASESVLVRAPTRTVADPAFRSTVRSVLVKLRTMPQVTNLRHGRCRSGLHGPARAADRVRHEGQAGHSRRAGATAARRCRTAAAGDAPGFTVAEFGDASATHELSKTIGKDFQNAEKLSVPITFVILLIAFGAFVAAGVPVLLAFSAVLGSVGLAALASHLVHASEATSSVILLMGMAVGVDYSLFYLKREREERAAGHRRHEALLRAAATSGQAVLVSGVTVLIAMAGMLLAGTKIFTSIGIGAMLVVFTAHGRLADRAAGAAGQAGRPAIERGVRQVLAATALRFLRPFGTTALAGLAARDADAAAAPQGRPTESRVWGFVLAGRCATRGRRWRLDGATARARAAGSGDAHEAARASATCPRACRSSRPTTRSRQRSPAPRTPAHVVVKGADVDDAAVRQRARGAEAARARERRDPRADPDAVNSATDRRASRHPARRRRDRTRPRCTRSRRCATQVIPPMLGDVAAGHAAAPLPARPRLRATSTRRSRHARRSCSRSSSASRSCCCCSRSARS